MPLELLNLERREKQRQHRISSMMWKQAAIIFVKVVFSKGNMYDEYSVKNTYTEDDRDDRLDHGCDRANDVNNATTNCRNDRSLFFRALE